MAWGSPPVPYCGDLWSEPADGIYPASKIKTEGKKQFPSNYFTTTQYRSNPGTVVLAWKNNSTYTNSLAYINHAP